MEKNLNCKISTNFQLYGGNRKS